MNYRIFPAIRRGFRPSRMTSNNLISPMKFCYNTNSTLPKQCQSSRSVLQDGSRTFGLFWKEKNPVLQPKKYGSRHCCDLPAVFDISPAKNVDCLGIEDDFNNIFVSPAKQKRDICTAFPAAASSLSSSSLAA